MWTITADHIDSGKFSAIGTVGPSNATLDAADIKATGKHFRLYDGDGELSYEGYCTSNDDDAAFDPLDDFGTPNAGCTAIKYRSQSGKYELL
jgi:hypothetical protein